MTVPQPAREHVPGRPAWQCSECSREWPCAEAKVNLMAEFVACRTAVLVYLAMCHAEAVRDHPGGMPPDLYGRFIGWATSIRS